MAQPPPDQPPKGRPPRVKRPTINEVAARAGVHRATAARALSPSGRHLLAAATVRKVQVAARELGYTPNRLATALRTDRSMTVGVLLPDLTNPMFPPVVRGLEDALRADGYTALLSSTDNDAEQEMLHFETLRGRRVDGFVIATARRSDPVLDRAAADGVPVVLLNRSDDSARFSLVTSDDADGIGQAVRHLTGLGHSRIAYLAGPAGVTTADTRVQAFRRETARAGLDEPATPLLRCANFTESDGIAGGRRLLAEHPEATAIMAGNDLIALGVLRAVAERGLRCPRDISVVGFNDMRFADAFHPPLTTVRTPQHDLGAEAAGLLLALLAEPDAARRVVRLPVRLVVRGSTAPGPPSPPSISKA